MKLLVMGKLHRGSKGNTRLILRESLGLALTVGTERIYPCRRHSLPVHRVLMRRSPVRSVCSSVQIEPCREPNSLCYFSCPGTAKTESHRIYARPCSEAKQTMRSLAARSPRDTSHYPPSPLFQ